MGATTTDGELIEAIKLRDERRVRALVKENPAHAEERDENGVSALMLTHYYRMESAAVLSARVTPLDIFEAATVGDLDRLRQLLDSEPALVRQRSSDTGTALHFASFFDQPEAVALLLERGADPDRISPTFGGVTPLHSAAASGNSDTVKALLQAGATVDARQQGGFTALHEAALTGNDEMVEVLLAAGAEVTLRADDGKTAADLAAGKGHDALAARLRAS